MAEAALAALAGDRDLPRLDLLRRGLVGRGGAQPRAAPARGRRRPVRGQAPRRRPVLHRGGRHPSSPPAATSEPSAAAPRSACAWPRPRPPACSTADLLGRPVADRLEAVDADVRRGGQRRGLDGLVRARSAADEIHSICTADDRDTRLRGLRVGLEAGGLPARATTRPPGGVIEAGSGSFLVERADPGADPAERELLEEMGHEAVLGVAAADLDGTYLIEVYARQRDRAAGGGRAGAAPAGAHGHPAAARRAHALRAPPAPRAAARAHQQAERPAGRGHRGRGRSSGAAVEELHGTLGYRICAIVQVMPDGMQEVVAESAGTGAGRWAGWRAPLSSGLIGRVITEGVPLLDQRRAQGARLPADRRHARTRWPSWTCRSGWGSASGARSRSRRTTSTPSTRTTCGCS